MRSQRRLVSPQIEETLDISGLQHYYKLNGNGNDSIGIKNAEIVNAVTYQAGSSGSEAIFNGSSSYVKLPSYLDGDSMTNVVSFTGFLTTALESTVSRFVSFNGNRFGMYVSLRTNQDSGKLSVYVNSNIITVLSTDGITLTNRNFIVITINKNGSIKIYINGTLITSMLMNSNIGGHISPAPRNYLGASRDGNYWHLNGTMEDWGFWNVELTQERVTAISNHQISGFELI